MIVITGGSGKAGRACISELVAHGYELCNIDLVSGSDPDIPFSQIDLTDFGQPWQRYLRSMNEFIM